jgi:TfoX/Sxy family transcriptional regulator of competence genes
MLSDQDLIAGVRTGLANTGTIREVKMFGGIGFMLNGNMVAAASKRGLMLRVGKEHYRDALTRPDTREVVMRGRPMEGYIRADPATLDTAKQRDLLGLAIAFVQTLPAKAPTGKSGRATRKR